MKTLIIRKPKFMRSDIVMKTYMDVAAAMSEQAAKPGISVSEQYELLKKAAECLNKAAEAGGFYSTKDFLKWAELNKEH